MKCIGCGKEISTDKKFCKYCATPVQKSIEAYEREKQAREREQQDMVQCPVCKNMVKSHNTFCTYCGAQLSKQEETETGRKPGGTGRKILKIILVIVLILTIAVIGVGAFYFIKIKNGTSGDRTTEAKETTQAAQTTQAETDDETAEYATSSGIQKTQTKEPDGTTAQKTEKKPLSYIDNKSMNFHACLSSDAYEEITSADGEFSFAYPKYLFNGGEYNDQINDYKLYYNNGTENEVYLHVYEKEQEGAPLDNIQLLKQSFSGIIRTQYYEWKSEEVDSKGMARVLLGGYTDDANTKGIYIIAANNGRKDYIMEFHYPDSDYTNLYKEVNYVVDCLYRFSSFGGGTYKPRTYQQFLDDEWGEKK